MAAPYPQDYPYADEESYFDQGDDGSYSYYEEETQRGRGPHNQSYHYQPNDEFSRRGPGMRGPHGGPTRGTSMLMGPAPPERRIRHQGPEWGGRTIQRFPSGVPPGIYEDLPPPPQDMVAMMDPFEGGYQQHLFDRAAPLTQQQSLYLAQMQELDRCRQRKALMPRKPTEDEAVFVAMLCSEQDELYGTNMLEDITPDDRIYIDSLIARGVPENEALRLSFERKPHPYKIKNKPEAVDTEADRNALEQAIMVSLTESSIRASRPNPPYSYGGSSSYGAPGADITEAVPGAVSVPGIRQQQREQELMQQQQQQLQQQEFTPPVDDINLDEMIGQLEDVPRPSAKADEEALQAAIRLSLLEAEGGGGGTGGGGTGGGGGGVGDQYRPNGVSMAAPAPGPAGSAACHRPSAIQMEINQRKAMHASYQQQQYQSQSHHVDVDHHHHHHHQRQQQYQHEHHDHYHRSGGSEYHYDSRHTDSGNDIRSDLDAEARHNRAHRPAHIPIAAPAPAPAPPAYHSNYNIQMSHQALHKNNNPLKKSHSVVRMEAEALAAAQALVEEERAEQRLRELNGSGSDEDDGDNSVGSSITHESSQERRRQEGVGREVTYTRNATGGKGGPQPPVKGGPPKMSPAPPGYSAPGAPTPPQGVVRKASPAMRPPMISSNSGSGKNGGRGIAVTTNGRTPQAAPAPVSTSNGHSRQSSLNSMGRDDLDSSSHHSGAHHAKYHVRGSLHEEKKDEPKTLWRHQSSSNLKKLVAALADDDDDELAVPIRSESAMKKLMDDDSSDDGH